MTEEQNAELKKEVQELLSQIVLKLQGIKEIPMEEGYNYQPSVGGAEYIEDENGDEIENPDYGTTDERYLSSTKQLCEMMAKTSDTSHILEQYYNSNC